jgi:hypothetical protein
MKYHKLRIAWSVGCGALAVLLIALWVRSYWKLDEFHLAKGKRLTRITSNCGGLQFATETDSMSGLYVEGWGLWRGDALPNAILPPMPQYSWSGFSYTRVGDSLAMVVPSWFPVLALAALILSTWVNELRWRFSLRTMLIGMTAVAMLLGALIWMARK